MCWRTTGWRRLRPRPRPTGLRHRRPGTSRPRPRPRRALPDRRPRWRKLRHEAREALGRVGEFFLAAAGKGPAIAIEEPRPGNSVDDVTVDQDAPDLRARGDLIHDVEERSLDDRAQPPGAGFPLEGLPGRGIQSLGREDKLHLVHFEESPVLPDEGVARLGEDRAQGAEVQRLDRGNHGQATNELRDHAVVHQVIRVDQSKDLGIGELTVIRLRRRSWEPESAASPGPLGDNVGQAVEGPSADEEDVGGVDLDELLLRMFAAALWRDIHGGAFDDLQERLLDTLA